jgi:hypothetical protein
MRSAFPKGKGHRRFALTDLRHPDLNFPSVSDIANHGTMSQNAFITGWHLEYAWHRNASAVWADKIRERIGSADLIPQS